MVFQIEPVEIKLRKWIQFRIEPVPHINFSDYHSRNTVFKKKKKIIVGIHYYSRLDGPKIL